MASSLRGLLFRCYNPIKSSSYVNFDVNYTPARFYAARKGTREKAKQKKIKIEQKKILKAPSKAAIQKLKHQQIVQTVEGEQQVMCEDDVFISKYHGFRSFTVEEAVNCHQETHDPSIFNSPNAFVNVIFELNMVAEKKTRFLDEFRKLVLLPFPFEYGDKKNILVLCKTAELQSAAVDAGADLVGGTELIKSIEGGDLSLVDFHSVIAHTNILTEVVTIKGLLKKKFPSPKSGTLGIDLDYMISRAKKGLQYECKKGSEHDFGWINTPIGTLNQGGEEIEQNFNTILQDINKIRPKRSGPFVTYGWLVSPPSLEKLKIDLTKYLSEEEGDNVEKEPETVEEKESNVDAEEKVSAEAR